MTDSAPRRILVRYQVIGGCIALTSWEPPDFLKVMLRRHVLQRVKGLALLSDPLSCEVSEPGIHSYVTFMEALL